MPSVIDQRVAAEFHIAVMDRLHRIDGISRKADSIVDQAVSSMIVLAINNKPEQIDSVFSQVFGDITKLFQSEFEKLATLSYEQTTDIFARNVPRKWVRTISPVGLQVGEVFGPLFSLIGRTATAVTAPVVNASARLNDSEWADYLRRFLFVPPTIERIQQIVLAPVNGINWAARISNLSRLIASPGQVTRELIQGYANGEGLRELTKRIEPIVSDVKSSAKRIARTEGLRIANQVQRDTNKPIESMLAGQQIIATLDQNTRPHHALRNGTVFYYDLGRSPSINLLPQLPDEPNCRCFDVPVFRPPAEFENDPAVRASFETPAGDSIPDPSAYSTWFSTATVEQRKLAVGSRRYNAVQAAVGGIREVEWTDFIEPTGKLLTLKKIADETGIERFRRKLLVQSAIQERVSLLNQVAARGFVELPKLTSI
jgi:SPP1 gp7 family putative phage head morphogenesis protein